MSSGRHTRQAAPQRISRGASLSLSYYLCLLFLVSSRNFSPGHRRESLKGDEKGTENAVQRYRGSDLILNRKPPSPSKLPKQRTAVGRAEGAANPTGQWDDATYHRAGNVCHKHEKMRDTESGSNSLFPWQPVLLNKKVNKKDNRIINFKKNISPIFLFLCNH